MGGGVELEVEVGAESIAHLLPVCSAARLYEGPWLLKPKSEVARKVTRENRESIEERGGS